MTETHKARLQEILAKEDDYPRSRFSGRGIVICAGGSRFYTCAWVCINVLRRVHKCTLPIQVWHLGPEEMGPPMKAYLEDLDVEVIDAFSVREHHPMRTLGGWEMKPYAIIHSPFREVILIDADNVPLIDPEVLFEWSAYEETGAIFWPDIVTITEDNPIWEICGTSFQKKSSFESGQVVLDKERCWKALELTLYMNAHSDFFYDHLYGDKDTFFMSWLMLEQPYGITPYQPKMINFTLCQRDLDGNIIFQHRNSSKWILFGKNHKVEGFELESECWSYLQELRSLWNGEVFQPPLQSSAANAAELRLCADRLHEFKTMSIGKSDIEFLSSNRIGEGRNNDRKLWCVTDGGHGIELQFFGDRGLSSILRLTEDGRWAGAEIYGEKTSVELRPLAVPDPPLEANDRLNAPRLEGTLNSPPPHLVKDCSREIISDLLSWFADSAQSPGDRAALSQTLRTMARIYANVPALLRDEVSRAYGDNRPVARALEPLLGERAGNLLEDQGVKTGHSSTSAKAHIDQYHYDFIKK